MRQGNRVQITVEVPCDCDEFCGFVHRESLGSPKAYVRVLGVNVRVPVRLWELMFYA